MSIALTPLAAAPVGRTHQVRPFEPGDLPAVVRLHRRTFASRRMPDGDLELF